MKVGMLRERLEEELYKEIYEINKTRIDKEKVLKGLIAKGFLAGHAQQIIAGNVGLEPLDKVKLGMIAGVFYGLTNNIMVNPEIYYEKETLEQIDNTRLEIIENELKLPIVFEGMTQYSRDTWVGTISLQKFTKLHQTGVSTYNFETQRDPIFKKYKGTTIKRVNINPKSVAEITNEIVRGTYLYDDVTLNILADGTEDFEFKVTNERFADGKKILTGDIIFKDGCLNLTDGAHRLKGAESALLMVPDLNGNFILVITNFDANKANDYIRQKDKRNPIDKEYLESKDITNLNNDIVRNINESSLSDLRGLIVTDEFLLNEGEGVTTFNIMVKTIEQLWSVKTRKDVRVISNYLIDFFNELIGLYPDELKYNIKLNRNKSYINHPNTMIYYLTIAKEIENDEDWIEVLYNILKSTDFSKNNKIWKETVEYINPSNFNDNRLARVIRHFKDNTLKRVI